MNPYTSNEPPAPQRQLPHEKNNKPDYPFLHKEGKRKQKGKGPEQQESKTGRIEIVRVNTPAHKREPKRR